MELSSKRESRIVIKRHLLSILARTGDSMGSVQRGEAKQLPDTQNRALKAVFLYVSFFRFYT